MQERPNQVLKLINAHITTTTIVMTQHDFLREIYNDFCIKNDMPKHKNLSAGDIKFASQDISITKYHWLQAYLKLWTNVGEILYGGIYDK